MIDVRNIKETRNAKTKVLSLTRWGGNNDRSLPKTGICSTNSKFSSIIPLSVGISRLMLTPSRTLAKRLKRIGTGREYLEIFVLSKKTRSFPRRRDVLFSFLISSTIPNLI